MVLLTKSIFPVATLIRPLDTASNVYISNKAPIPKSSSDYYSLKFNPFHVSWLEYYQSKCETVSNVAKI